MKKEAKLVLIVWILGLFVSVMYLVFMNWKTVDDDTNIPVLEENNQIQTWENILTWISQESSTWIQDLTWNDILTWNIGLESESGQIKNNFDMTWNILTWENMTWNLQKTWQIIKNEIVVMIPKWFFNDWFEQLSKQIFQQTWILVRYQKMENLAEYKKYLIENQTWSVDIYLLPSDWLKNFSWKNINLWEDIKPYFHSIFAEFINDNKIWFVPYSIDPLVTFVNKNSAYSQDVIDTKNLFSYVVSWKRSKSMAIPFLFGAGENDVKLLEKNQESFPDYFTFWYNLIYQFKKWKNTIWLNSFFDTINFNSDYKWDLLEFKKLVINIAKRNPNCKDHPSICLFSYRFADIIFGFVSDQNIINNFTWWGIWLDNVSIYNFPISSDDYKIRAWWFVVDDDSLHDNQVDYFLKMYIKTSILNSLPLWDNNLSAFNNIFQIQKIQKRYENILKYESKFSLMYNEINLQENFIKKTNLINLLKWGYKTDLFLNNLDREF